MGTKRDRPVKPDSGHLVATDFEVRKCGQAEARDLIEKEHYAGGASNTYVALHGLYAKGYEDLLGVTWWLPPTKIAALSVWENHSKVLSLSRLALVKGMPVNATSYLIGRSIRLLRRTDPRWECLLTYADTWQGHTGAIYRATNWEELGMTRPYPVYVDAAGKCVSRKKGPKTLNHQQMLAAGYRFLGKFPKYKFRMVITP